MRTRITNIVMTPGVSGEEHIPFIEDAEILIQDQTIVYAGKRAEAPAFERMKPSTVKALWPCPVCATCTRIRP